MTNSCRAEEELEASKKEEIEEADKSAERDAKFLLYWLTTTITSTSTTVSTTFSSTHTLTLTSCTPSTVIATCKYYAGIFDRIHNKFYWENPFYLL